VTKPAGRLDYLTQPQTRTIDQVAIFLHSSAQDLQASPQSLHSVILGELVAFFLAIVANHLDGFSKMAGMLGIDRRKRV
jgi:hypothetical protein